MQPYVYFSIIYNSQAMETTEISSEKDKYHMISLLYGS